MNTNATDAPGTEPFWYDSTPKLKQGLQALKSYPDYVQELIGKELNKYAKELSYTYAKPESDANGEEASLEGLKKLRYFMQNKQHHSQVGRALNEIMVVNDAGRSLIGRHLALCVQGLEVLKKQLEDDELSFSPQNRVVVHSLVQAVFSENIEAIENKARERAAREAAQQVADADAQLAEMALLEAASQLEGWGNALDDDTWPDEGKTFLEKGTLMPKGFEPEVTRMGALLVLTLRGSKAPLTLDVVSPSESMDEHQSEDTTEQVNEISELRAVSQSTPPLRKEKPALNLEAALAQFNAMEAAEEQPEAESTEALTTDATLTEAIEVERVSDDAFQDSTLLPIAEGLTSSKAATTGLNELLMDDRGQPSRIAIEQFIQADVEAEEDDGDVPLFARERRTKAKQALQNQSAEALPSTAEVLNHEVTFEIPSPMDLSTLENEILPTNDEAHASSPPNKLVQTKQVSATVETPKTKKTPKKPVKKTNVQPTKLPTESPTKAVKKASKPQKAVDAEKSAVKKRSASSSSSKESTTNKATKAITQARPPRSKKKEVMDQNASKSPEGK